VIHSPSQDYPPSYGDSTTQNADQAAARLKKNVIEDRGAMASGRLGYARRLAFVAAPISVRRRVWR